MATDTSTLNATATAPVPGTSARTPRAPRPILIMRDYSQGEMCQFSKQYVTELQGQVSVEDFTNTVNTINRFLAKAESLGKENLVESLIGCISCFTSYLFITTHYEKCVQMIVTFVESENERVYNPAGLELRNPLRNGLQYIEITKR